MGLNCLYHSLHPCHHKCLWRQEYGSVAEELLCLCCCYSLSFVFGSHWAVFRVYSWLCGTELFLAVLRFGRSGIKLGLAVCQESSSYYLLTPALSLWSQSKCMREASASRLSTTNPKTDNQITTLTYTYLHSHFFHSLPPIYIHIQPINPRAIPQANSVSPSYHPLGQQ